MIEVIMDDRDFEINNTPVDTGATPVTDAKSEKAKKKLAESEAMVKELTGMKSKKKKLFMIIFLIANILAIALTAILEFGGSKESVQPGEVLAIWGQNWIFILFAIACLAVLLSVETLKFAFFFKKVTGKFNLKLAWSTLIQGKYYDNITPSATGGQPFQVYHMSKHGIEPGRATAIAIMCFFLTQIAFTVSCFVLISIYGMNLVPEGIVITAYIGAVLAVITPVLLITASFIPKTAKKLLDLCVTLLVKIKIIKNREKAIEKVHDYIDEYSHSMALMKNMKGTLLVNLILSVISTLASASIPYFVILCCGQHIPYFEVLTMCQMTYAAVSFIPTPGGSGAAEASFYIVFGVLGGGFLFMGMLLWRFISFYSILFIGLGVIISSYTRNGKNKRTVTQDGSN